MLKNILNLNGAQELSKNEQKSTIGGGDSKMINCTSDFQCEQTGIYCPGKVRCMLPFGVCLGKLNTGSC